MAVGGAQEETETSEEPPAACDTWEECKPASAEQPVEGPADEPVAKKEADTVTGGGD
jgi:hypothetical protein